jgi:hypothetical protein
MENNKNEEGTKDIENNKNKEETKDLDRYEKIVKFAQEEIAGVRTVYILYAKILGTIILAGLTIGTILIGHSISDTRKSMNDEFQSMKSGVYADVNTFQRQVNNRIDEEFKTEKMQSLIEDKAREYTEKAAQQYIANEVNEMITPVKNEMKQAIDDANEKVGNLAKLYHVLLIADIAKSGSKKAYLELERFAAKENTEEGVVAQNNLKEIKRNLEQYRHTNKNIFTQMPLVFKQQGKEVSIGNEPVTVLVNSLIISNFSDEYRQILMRYIAKKPKEEIFREALRVFESDSLPACAIFCGILSEISEEKADFLDFNAWTEICKKQVNKQ